MSAGNRLTREPSFNPQSLTDIAPPLPGEQSWQWLLSPSIDKESKKAYLKQHVYGSGVVGPSARGLTLQPRPRDYVVDSHLTQHVFFDFQGAPNVRVRLSAAEPAAEPGAEPGGEPEAAPGRFPFTAPVAIIGSIPPSASAAQSVGRDLLGGLARDLRERGIGYLSGVAADHDREWVERVLIVDCSEEWQVRHAAMVHLQPFITVWRETDGYGILEVLDVRPGAPGQPMAQRPAALHKVSARTCPMSAHTRSGDLCRMAGGPWTSGSIHYAGAWETKRGRMIDALDDQFQGVSGRMRAGIV